MKDPDITRRPKGPGIDRVEEIGWELDKERHEAAKKRSEG